MTFTFKLSRRLALIFALMTGSAMLSCSVDEPSGSTPYSPAPPAAIGDTLFAEGFETGVLAWDDNYGPQSKQILTGAARTGTRGLRVTFSPSSDAGTLSKFVTRGDRVHVRMAVRFSVNWTGSAGLLALRAAPATSQWAGFGVGGLCPTGSTWAVTGMTTTSANLDLRFKTSYVGMPAVSGSCPASTGTSGASTATYAAASGMSKGVWHVVEIEAQLNTVGQANGWQRVWLDGVLTGEWKGLTFRTSSLVQWNAVSLEMPASGVTTSQSLDIDDILVQPQRTEPAIGAPPPPAPTTLFAESFDNTSFSSRGWYDFATTPAVATADKHAGTGSLLVQLAAGAQAPPMRVMRKLFEPTDRLYISYWVKYSTNYVGSGRNYHPHEFIVLSNQDQDWDGLTFNYLNTYIEQNYQNGGRPRIAIQDSRMIDASRIGVNLTGVTEQRSLGGCNGNSDGTGITDCLQSGSQWYNLKTWDAAAVAFMPSPGADYKGNWNHVEVEFRLNSVIGGIGQKDGVVRYWLNGDLKLERTNVMFRTGANPALKFKQFVLSPYIGDGSPVTQQMWIDELTVGTDRPVASTTPQPAPVASVTVTPTSASVQVGGATTLNAVLRDAAGAILGGRLVTWTTSAATVATVVGGVVTAISAGQATVTATSEGRSGSAVITVTSVAQPIPVATVTVSPTSASLPVGGTTQLSAVTRSSTGAQITGRRISWSTLAPSVATVVNGLVTGAGAGQTTITATSEGVSASATVTVTAAAPAPPPSSRWPNEPTGMRLVTEYGFDDVLPNPGPYVPVGTSGWQIHNPQSSNGYAARASDPGAPVSPEFVGQWNYPIGYAGGGEPANLWYDVGGGTELYIGFYWRTSNPWQNIPSGINKIAFQFAGSGGSVYLAKLNDGRLRACLEFTTDFARNLDPNVGSPISIQHGRWYLIELYLNRTTGTLRTYVNGTLQGSYSNVRFPPERFGEFQFAPTWGGGTPADRKSTNDYFQYDHVRISKR